ncbi:hypothetical protein ABLT60_15315 [Acinetobacter ursingii]|uniref:hypothetical protein n=1 Tax=Acinetobacter ursingii TaxID=108980 RepID=UPI0032B5B8CD
MKRQSKKSEHITSNWTIEQDSFLIENSFMVIEQLINHLPFTEDGKRPLNPIPIF